MTTKDETALPVDGQWLLHLMKQQHRNAEQTKKRIYRMRPGEKKGVPFNIGSDKQLNEILFGNFVVRKDKKIRVSFRPDTFEFEITPRGEPSKKSGLFSVAREVMKQYARDGHEVVQMIMDVNRVDHLVSMVKGWLERAVKHDDGTYRKSRRGDLNHKVDVVEPLNELRVMYTITVTPCHNFVLSCGVVSADHHVNRLD